MRAFCGQAGMFAVGEAGRGLFGALEMLAQRNLYGGRYSQSAKTVVSAFMNVSDDAWTPHHKDTFEAGVRSHRGRANGAT